MWTAGSIRGACHEQGGRAVEASGHAADPSNWRNHPAVRSGDKLIAAKRKDQISSELAQHDYEPNVEADAIVTSIEQLTREIHARVVQGDKMGS